MKSNLPSISAVRRRCQALAALDLILSPMWEYRYFSFNSRWSPGQHTGSMRNGSGDEWFCLFHQDGWAGLKGLGHESRAWRDGGSALSAELKRSVPTPLSEFSSEPAFRWEATSFALYSLSESDRWICLNDLSHYSSLDSGVEEHLTLLVAAPDAYVSHASHYFEVELDLILVEHIFALRPLTNAIVKKVNEAIDVESVASELFDEIGYPK